MTRRKRLERRLEKRKEWARARDRKAKAGFDRAGAIADGIPMGQPILVGHHSERHARRDAERIHARMRAGCESQDMAELHRSKAAGIERQLERTIFSDDPDAAERLEEKIAAMEERRTRMKEINAAIRKGPGWGDRLVLSEQEKEDLLKSARFSGKCGYSAYALTNLGANIRRLKERLAQVKSRADQARKAEEAGGVVIEVFSNRQFSDDKYATVTFAEKPDRGILDALKAAGFWWGHGKWTGSESKLPECVRELAKEATNVQG